MTDPQAALEAAYTSDLYDFQSWRTTDGRSPQAAFFRAASTARVRVFRSGNRVGKTTAGGVDVLLHLLGWHPWGQHKPPCHWWASGVDWEFGVGQVLWPKIREYLPMDQVSSIAWYRRAEPSIPLSIVFKNGSQLDFKSGDSGRRKYQGTDLNGVWIDEEHPADVVEEARTRLLHTKGYLTVTLTPLMRMRWVQEIEREQDAAIFRASMMDAADAGLLDLEVVKRFAKSLPERQRRVRVHGDFVALEGQVYPDLIEETHSARPLGAQLRMGEKTIAPWPIPDEWQRVAAVDWGYVNPTAVPIAACCPFTGRLIVYRCYYSSGIRASEWARLLLDRLPRLRLALISDHDAQARAECEAEGLPTTPAKKTIDAGLEAVERTLQPLEDGLPGLVFVVNEETDKVLGRCDAHKVLWEAEHYHYPMTRQGRPDPRDQPVKKDDHAMDALRYLVVGWEGGRNGFNKPPAFYRHDDEDEDEEDDNWL